MGYEKKKKQEVVYEVVYVEVEFADIAKETDKAWLIETLDGKKTWYPKSKCQLAEANILRVPDWIINNQK